MKRSDRTADRCLLCVALFAAVCFGVLTWFFALRPNTSSLIPLGLLLLASLAAGFPLYRQRIYARVPARKVLFASIGLSMPLLGLEVVANLADPGGYLYFADAQRYFAGQRYDLLPDHEHPPHYAPHVRWGPLQINEHGWRGESIAENRAEGVTRVAGLGDSVLLGWGLPEETAVGAVLERKLGEVSRAKVELVNTGHGSFGALDELLVLREKVLPLRPDAVFVLVVGNDFLDRPPYRDQVDWLERQGTPPESLRILRAAEVERPRPVGPQNSAGRGLYMGVSYLLCRSFTLTAGLMAAQGRSLFSGPETVRYDRTPQTPAQLVTRFRYLASQAQALLEIKRVCQARQIPVMFFLYTKDPPLDLYLQEQLRPAAVVPLLIPEGSRPSDWQNSVADTHWNARATRHFAELMANAIHEELLTK